MSDLVLRVTLTEGQRSPYGTMKQVAVEALQGVPTDDDILGAALGMASAIITKRSKTEDLEDLLEHVWNRLADMVETCIAPDLEDLH